MDVMPFLAARDTCVLMLYCIVTIVCYVCSFEWQIKFSLSLMHQLIRTRDKKMLPNISTPHRSGRRHQRKYSCNTKLSHDRHPPSMATCQPIDISGRLSQSPSDQPTTTLLLSIDRHTLYFQLLQCT